MSRALEYLRRRGGLVDCCGSNPRVELFVDWVRIRKRRSECERTEPSLTTLLRQQDIGGSLD
jgi:hypothetical protein